MNSTIRTEWKGNMAFEWDVKGFKVLIDADEAVGGEGKGPQPKPFMLAALGGCTGMDVISILKKMQVSDQLAGFAVETDGTLTEEQPKHYIAIHTKYVFQPKLGMALDMEKLQKAIRLSEEKYCGVGAVYRKAGIQMTSEIVIK